MTELVGEDSIYKKEKEKNPQEKVNLIYKLSY